jgi:hypothetical protein
MTERVDILIIASSIAELVEQLHCPCGKNEGRRPSLFVKKGTMCVVPAEILWTSVQIAVISSVE